MNKLIFSILILLISFGTNAQRKEKSSFSDSCHIVELNEVMVRGKQKNNNQHLVHFFRSNQSATLEDILSRLPELSLVRRGSYGMEPTIRSMNGGQINVMVDGMRIYGACTDKMDPATIYIEPSNLENLQVQTAHTGFLNGSSIGGTLNMKIAGPHFQDDKKITGSFSSGYQSASKGFYESLLLNYSSGKWAFRASGTYRKNKSYRSGGGETIPFSQYEKANYSLSVKYRIDDFSYLKADLLGDDGWNIGYPALPMDVGYAAARIGSLSWHSDNLNKAWYRKEVKLYANRITHYMDDTRRPNVPVHMDMPGLSKTTGFYAEGERSLGAKSRLQLKADGSTSLLNASMTMYQPGELPMYMLTWPDNRKNQYGAGISWTFQADSLTQIRINTRADLVTYQLITSEAKDQVSIFGYPDANRTDWLKNFAVQASRSLFSSLKVSGGISYTERVPTASELYGFYLFNNLDRFDYVGNPGLKNEKALQADFSLLYNVNKNRFQITAFHSRIDNYITGIIEPSFSSMTIGAGGVKKWINIDQARLTGIEASAFLKPLKSMDLISTFRYTSGRDHQSNPLPNIAPLKWLTSINYAINKFSARMEYETASRQNRFNIAAGEDATRGYFLLHMRAGYRTTLFKTLLNIQTGVENILDKKYHEHLDWGNISRPGRNIYLQVTVGF